MFRRNITLPLNSLQQNMVLSENYNSSHTNSLRNMVTLSLKGTLSIANLEKALRLLTKRHEALRCKLTHNDNVYFLETICTPKQSINWPLYKSSIPLKGTESIIEKKLYLENTIKEHFNTHPISLEEGPLWQAILMNTDIEQYQLSFLFHQLVMDETSINLFLNELFVIYDTLYQAEELSLPTMTPLHAIYSPPLIQNEFENLQYWNQELNTLTPLRFPNENITQNQTAKMSNRYDLSLPQTLALSLKTHSTLKHYTLSTIFLSCLFYLSYYQTNEKNLSIGMKCNDREKYKDQLYSFVNALPIHIDISQLTSFQDILNQVDEKTKQATKHQLPIHDILKRRINEENTAQKNTLLPYSIFLAINENLNIPKSNFLELSNVDEIDQHIGKFHHFGLNLNHYTDESLSGFIEYNTALFTSKNIADLNQRLTLLLQTIMENSDIPLAEINLLLDEDKKIIHAINQHPAEAIRFESLLKALQHTTLLRPKQPAITYHHQDSSTDSITYEDLDRASTNLTNILKKQGVKPGDVIGVCLPRSIDLFIGMFAIWKCHATLLTLDQHDNAKTATKLDITNTKYLIVNENTEPLFAEYQNLHTVNIQHMIGNSVNETSNNLLENRSSTPPISEPIDECEDHRYIPTNAAYIMFTSGTTGLLPIPKGVSISYAALTNLLNALSHKKIHDNAQVFSTAQPTFDAFLYDLLITLVTSGTLHLPYDEGRFRPSVIEKITHSHNISYIVLLPEILDKLDHSLPLKHIVTMGSAVHEETLKQIQEINPSVRIENGYGLTETCICLTLSPWLPDDTPNLIGKPIPEMEVYILNPDTLRPCPLNTPGEVCITGIGVAAGYLQNPELTEKKFLNVIYDKEQDRFFPIQKNQDQHGIKLYRTGDLGCYTYNKMGSPSIQFHNRLDRKVKIKGEQIELDVVEQYLKKYKLIKDAIILPDSQNEKIIAYIIPSDPLIERKELDQKVREWLKRSSLPSVGRPGTLIFTDFFPLTANGKVDNQKLIELSTLDLNQEEENSDTLNQFPESDLNEQLKFIFATAVNCSPKEININDTFEALGGDSYSITTVESLLSSHLNLTAPVIYDLLNKDMTIQSLKEALDFNDTMIQITEFNLDYGPTPIIDDSNNPPDNFHIFRSNHL